MTTGCICGGGESCAHCRSAQRAKHVDRLRLNVVATAKWCRSKGMPMPSELRTALEQLAIAERQSEGGHR